MDVSFQMLDQLVTHWKMRRKRRGKGKKEKEKSKKGMEEEK